MKSVTRRPQSGATIETSFGPVGLLWNQEARLVAVKLMSQTDVNPVGPLPEPFLSLSKTIVSYFDGELVDFHPYLSLCELSGVTEFRQRVYAKVANIPYGQTRSYAAVAGAVQSPKAMRAIGGAMAANPFPLIVPCHRVVAANGLGGFSAGGGVELKLKMLELERTALA